MTSFNTAIKTLKRISFEIKDVETLFILSGGAGRRPLQENLRV